MPVLTDGDCQHNYGAYQEPFLWHWMSQQRKTFVQKRKDCKRYYNFLLSSPYEIAPVDEENVGHYAVEWDKIE